MGFLDRYVIRVSWWSLKKIYRVMIVASVGTLFIGLIGFYLYMSSLPTLSTWHTTLLKNEFTTHSKIKNISEYMALEEKLFNPLGNNSPTLGS
jgi:hypothetical protein